MKRRIRQSLLAGVAATSLGLAGIAGAGVASADSDTSGRASLTGESATKFNANGGQVAAVFAAGRASRLKQAVADGKITQTQADYIMGVQKDIDGLMAGTGPRQQTDAERANVKAKIDALRAWARANNIDQQYIGGMAGHGGRDGGTPPPDSNPANWG